MALAAALGLYLDMDLPFPCTVGWGGLAESRSLSAFKTSPTIPSRLRAYGDAPWVRPCVLHPLLDRWHFFSIYEGVCTSEFASALRLSEENLRGLCARQGATAPLALSTTQLVARCLDAAIFGCSPPLEVEEALGPGSAARRGRSSGLGYGGRVGAQSRGLPRESCRKREVYAFEDGEWTVLEPGDAARPPFVSDPGSNAAPSDRPCRPRTSTF